MNYQQIEQLASGVYETCDTREVPIDCQSILNHYGLKAINIDTWKKTQPELYGLCLDFSEDSFLYRTKKLIIYKDLDHNRTRFSLMHELGHYLMNHHHSSFGEEHEANHFASYILAPRPLIRYMGIPTPHNLSLRFGISRQAAEIAGREYYVWWNNLHGGLSDWEERLLIRFLGEDYASEQSLRTCDCDRWAARPYIPPVRNVYYRRPVPDISCYLPYKVSRFRSREEEELFNRLEDKYYSPG